MSIDKNHVLSLEHVFAADVPTVYKALKQGRLFFNCGAYPQKSSIDFKVGGKYVLDFGQNGQANGVFTEIVENKRISFTWGFKDMELNPDSITRVSIDLFAEGKKCRLKLKHEGFKDQETAEAHQGGWCEGFKGMEDETTQRVVRLGREFMVPVEVLFDACSKAALFAPVGADLVNSTIDFRVGGEYSIANEKGKPTHGKFVEIVPNKKIVMTWESGCDATSGKTTRVTMTFEPSEDNARHSYLELTHDGFDTLEQAYQHHQGWNIVIHGLLERTKN